jgi:lipopolysaccharide assembly protein A
LEDGSLAVKQINFLIIFVLSVALVLFALENTDSAIIQILPNFALEAPLSIALIAAAGVGAIFAWLFSVWTSTQTALSSIGKNKQIQNLQRKVSDLSNQVQERNKVLTSSPAIDVEVEEKPN